MRKRTTATRHDLCNASRVRDLSGNWHRVVHIERAHVVILVAGEYTDTIPFRMIGAHA